LVFLFVACSSKQYFEPQNTSSIDINIIDTPAYIKSITSVGATLDDNRYLDHIGISSAKLKDGYLFLNNSNGNIISANKKGELYINNDLHFKFKSNVVSANFSENLLAVVFANNTIALYDTKNKIFRLKKYLEISYLNDTRLAMPLFLKSTIVFPTLDGKVLIVDKNSYEVTKTINIDPNSQVNNIILLKVIGKYLIIASSNKILSIGEGNSFHKEFYIQSYALSEKYIYIATLDGKIVKLDRTLEIKAQHKFKFAKFQAIAVDKSIFAIESQGYIVKSNLDFTKIQIDKISFENDEKTFVSKNKIYFENRLLQF
jgi:hypothetical protein